MIQSSGADPKLAAELIALNVEVMLAAGLMGGVLFGEAGRDVTGKYLVVW